MRHGVKTMQIPEETERPELQIGGEDGNAYMIIGRAQKAWRRAGLSTSAWKEIEREMVSGDYDHLINTVMKHFDTE
jgi:hypothetical protein